MVEQTCELGMIGLGVMGRNLALNIAEHGHPTAGYDLDPAKVKALTDEAGDLHVTSSGDMAGFIRLLRAPRIIMMMVPAGPPVDAVIRELLPHLGQGDLVIDGGNSYFKDTELRGKTLAERGVQYLGVGISGGEWGARHGPSLMVGGTPEAYERVRPIFEAIAARVESHAAVLRTPLPTEGDEGEPKHNGSDTNGTHVVASEPAGEGTIDPAGPVGEADTAETMPGNPVERAAAEACVAYLGPGSAGHYVKMVHNGIEYALIQLIAETYDLLARGLLYNDDQLKDVYAAWNQSELNSYLLDITARIFQQVDERSGKRLIDVILDEAGQKGTGKWSSQNAMDLGVPVPTIDAAVAVRALSVLKGEREAAAEVLKGPERASHGDNALFLEYLRNALYVGMVSAYAQGMALLRAGSEAYHFGLNLEEVARIWRGGCIVRAAILEQIQAGYATRPDLPNLLMDTTLGWEVMARQADLRATVRIAAALGIPTPALMATLAYYDGYRSAWLPANLIQAQRDYFGAHTYERNDTKGVFHTRWAEA